MLFNIFMRQTLTDKFLEVTQKYELRVFFKEKIQWSPAISNTRYLELLAWSLQHLQSTSLQNVPLSRTSLSRIIRYLKQIFWSLRSINSRYLKLFRKSSSSCRNQPWIFLLVYLNSVSIKFSNAITWIEFRKEKELFKTFFVNSWLETVMMSKRKLTVKTLNEKCRVLNDIERGLSKKDASLKYRVPPNTISTWIKNDEKYLKALENNCSSKKQKLRESNFEKFENVVLRWFLSKRSQNIPIDDNLIKEKAIAYAKELGYTNFVGSTGWLDRWKRR